MPAEAALAVRDRIEDRGVGLAGIADRRGLVEQELHVVGHALGQRDLDEDQRLVGHARMEIGKAAPVGVEPVLEIGPAPDLVHRLVDGELLEQRRRRIPGDAPHLEEADVEPAREQPLEVELERRERRRRRAPAAISSARMSTRNFTPSGRALNWVSSLIRGGSSAWRSARSSLRCSSSLWARRSRSQVAWTAARSMSNSVARSAQEALAPGGVEGEIGAAERGRPRPRRDLAALAFETVAQLARAAGRHRRRRARAAARRSSTPRAEAAMSRQHRAQVAEGPVEDRVEKAGGAALAHDADIIDRASGYRMECQSGTGWHPPRLTALRGGAQAAQRRAAGARAGRRRRGRGRTPAAASPCSQAAAAAARNGSSPCARSPAIMPASTSPLPPVASSGGALALIAARPSGAAITVSAPLSSTTAPVRAAAARARASLSSPSASCRTAGRTRPRAGSARWRRRSRAKSASAPAGENRQRVGIEHRRAPRGERGQQRRAASPRRSGAGPDQDGVAARDRRARPAKPSSPATGRTMTPVSDGGIDRPGRHRRRDGDEPGPDPRRRPRRQPRRAGHHRARPAPGHGRGGIYGRPLPARDRRRATAPGRSRTCRGGIAASTRSGMPMSARMTLPHKLPTRQQQMAGLLAEEGDGERGRRAAPRTAPVAPSRPLGTSTASDRQMPRAASASITARAMPVDRTGEAGAEDRIDDHAGAVEQRRGQRLDRSWPQGRMMRRIAAEPLARAEKAEPDRPAGRGKMPRRDEAVAAIIAGPAQHRDRPRRPAPHHRNGDGRARRLHQRSRRQRPQRPPRGRPRPSPPA